jgi:hypothetical protein
MNSGELVSPGHASEMAGLKSAEASGWQQNNLASVLP